ncbi:MAG: peptidylprolyl isomerase [Candidatus Hydrogenedentes bacterium]|nr:peptidylprolyl isomerase [Candidatus Hydrogenedentota bacterium]
MVHIYLKRLVIITLIIIVTCPFYATGGSRGDGFSSLPENKILVRIGSYNITVGDFNAYLKYREFELLEYPPALFPKAIETFKSKVLEEIVFQQMVFILATEDNTTYEEKEVDEILQSGIESLGGQEVYKRWLKENGVDEDYIKEQIKRKIMIDKYIEKVKRDISIPEEKIKETYLQLSNKGIIRRTADTYDFANIFLPDFTNSPEVENQIKSIYLKLQEGEDFFSAARKYSKDSFSTKQGFSYYEVTLREVLPEVKHYLVLLPVGSVSPPFRSRNGWNIIKVLGKYQKGTTIPYEKMRLGLEKQLTEIELKKILNQRIEKLKEKIDVVYEK